MYEYNCLRCGRRLTFDEHGDDSSAPILFDLSEPLGFATDEKRNIPSYFTLEEMKKMVDDPQCDGKSFTKIKINFDDLISAISKRLSRAELSKLDKDRMSKYLKKNDEAQYETEELISRCILDSSELVGDLGNDNIDEFCRKVSNIFFDGQGEPKTFEFRIKVNLSALGRSDTQLGYSYRLGEDEEQFPRVQVICGDPGCFKNRRKTTGAPVPAMAWQNEHITVGFIGAAGSGKTCLITAVLSKLLEKGQLIEGDNYEGVRACLKAYESNHELPKTELEGRNSFNATVVLGDKLITLVDISGECFDLDTGKFHKNIASNYFRLIRGCKCYVLCLDPKNSVYSGRGLAAQSVGDFADYLRSGDMGYAAPILLTMTKCDCDAPDFECYDLDSVELEDEAQERFELFLEKSGKLVAKNYPSFFTNIQERAYIASAVTSAYGCVPMPDERDMPGISKLREMYKSLSIYLTSDGRYYVTPDEYRDDYLVPKNVAGQYYVVKNTENGREYIFDPSKDDAKLGLKKLSDIRLIPNDPTRLNKGSGRIFESEDYADVPAPINISILLEWILRVCGARRIFYSEFDERSGVTKLCDHVLKPTDKWSRDESKTSSPKLAACACSLFSNPSELDCWTDEYSANRGSRMLMGLFEKVGFNTGVNKLLGTVKRKGQV